MSRATLLESLIRRSRGTPPVPPTPSIPTDYVFYAPFTEDLDDESQYQRTMTLSGGTATYDTVDGIACVQIPANQHLYSSDISGITSGDHSHATSVWAKFTTTPQSSYGILFGFGATGSAHKSFIAAIYGQKYYLSTWGFDGAKNVTADTSWHHLLVNHDSSTGAYSLYIDGVLADSQTNSSVLSLDATGGIFLHAGVRSNGTSTDCQITSTVCYRNARIYDRALTSDEIAALAGELSPTTE